MLDFLILVLLEKNRSLTYPFFLRNRDYLTSLLKSEKALCLMELLQ